MDDELVELRPSELKFVFELKKQSSCSVQLINKTICHVAFKVKTTAPKKYCVRPNVGIVAPKSSCDFTVTMQAQKVAPSDLQCKDKFLVQTIVVPAGTTEESLLSTLFSKESGRYIEENKLRVVFIRPPHSPINGSLNKEFAVSQETLLSEIPLKSQRLASTKASDLAEFPVDPKSYKPLEDISTEKISPLKNSPVESKFSKMVEANSGAASNIDRAQSWGNHMPFQLMEDIDKISPIKNSPLESKFNGVAETNGGENLASKVALLESKLKEAEMTIARLTEAHEAASLQKSKLQQDAVLLRRRAAAKGQVGFPFLFVCFVALVALTVGYLVHS